MRQPKREPKALRTIADFDREVGRLERGDGRAGLSARELERRLVGRGWPSPRDRDLAQALVCRLAVARLSKRHG